MQTKTILKAIEVLQKASNALASGSLDISEQIRLSSECTSSAFYLRHELEKAVPEVKIAA